MVKFMGRASTLGLFYRCRFQKWNGQRVGNGPGSDFSSCAFNRSITVSFETAVVRPYLLG